MNIFYGLGWLAGTINKHYQNGYCKAESGLPMKSITGDDDLDKIYMLLQNQGSYIRAIRMYRDFYRCDTMEAKDAVTDLIKKYNMDIDKIKAQIKPDMYGNDISI